MTWTSQSSADATDRAGSTADVACETSCSSLWSLLLGHSWLSSCYRLICRVLYYPNRGAEVRALLTDAQRARVLTLAVVDLVFALSMLPQPPELLPLRVLDWSALESFRLHFDDGLMRVVADDAAATDGNTSELPPSWDLAVEAPAATDLVWMGATNWATRQMLCLTKRARAWASCAGDERREGTQQRRHLLGQPASGRRHPARGGRAWAFDIQHPTCHENNSSTCTPKSFPQRHKVGWHFGNCRQCRLVVDWPLLKTALRG